MGLLLSANRMTLFQLLFIIIASSINRLYVGKPLNLKKVMHIAMKTVRSIRARNLRRRLFLTYLEGAEAQHIDLLLHRDVR